jgi:SAM-dependent methyltransferase
MKKEKKLIKINLGCGIHTHSGFINVDNYFTFNDLKKKKGVFGAAIVEPNSKFVQADIMKQLPFPDNYADYIISVDVIEHIPIRKVISVLKEVYRIMKPGGKFVLITTDFPNVILSWLDMMNKGENLEEFIQCSQVVYGNQVHEGEFHKCPFTPKFMNLVLQEAGFGNYKLTKYFKGSLIPKFDGDIYKKGMVFINDMLVVEATKLLGEQNSEHVVKEETLKTKQKK